MEKNQKAAAAAPAPPTPKPAPTPPSVSHPPRAPNIAVAKAVFHARDSDELSFNKGDEIEILGDAEDEGWKNAILHGRRGVVPVTHLENVPVLGSGTAFGYPWADARQVPAHDASALAAAAESGTARGIFISGSNMGSKEPKEPARRSKTKQPDRQAASPMEDIRKLTPKHPQAFSGRKQAQIPDSFNHKAPKHNLGDDVSGKPKRKPPAITMAQLDFWFFVLFVTAFWLFVIIMLSTTGTPENMGNGVFPDEENVHVTFHFIDERSTPLGGADAGSKFVNKQDFGLESACPRRVANWWINIGCLVFLGFVALR